MARVHKVTLPITDMLPFHIGDRVTFTGQILCGRDAALPRVCKLLADGQISELEVDLKGSAVFHTAVSDAGIGPTSSNKVELEESFEPLCRAGVKVFLGKGAISASTVAKLGEHGAIYCVVPPVTALLRAGMRSKRIVAWPELGMEALWELELDECPAVVAVAQGKSLFGGD